LRKDLKIKRLPFIAGDLANFYGIGRTEKHIKGIITVRNVLRTLPEKIKNTAFVESTGLYWEGEGHVHFDRDAYIEFGKRYEQAYTLLKK
jgi:ketosteroid isomerase-like protein